jgi:hypothetical protein
VLPSPIEPDGLLPLHRCNCCKALLAGDAFANVIARPVPAAASCVPTGQGPKRTGIGTTGCRAPSPLTKTAEPSVQPSCAMRWACHHYLHHLRKDATAVGITARSIATVARCSA